MAITDSLFSISQNFYSPDIIRKISSEIKQPVEQTKAGLKSIIPTLLWGIVEKGSTKEGAESLLNIASKESFKPEVNLDHMNNRLGSELIHNIFGDNLTNVVSKLGFSTGMNTSSVIKILTMAAPAMMGAVSLKIKNEKLNPSGLMYFLNQQRITLTGLIPGMSGLANLGSGVGFKSDESDRGVSWGKIVIIAFLALLITWWFSTHQGTVNAPTTVLPMKAPMMIETYSPGSIEGLSTFLNTVGGVPVKRFSLKSITFELGSSNLNKEAFGELNQIAALLEKYPRAKVTLASYTDDLGLAEDNELLSYQRALVVRAALIDRGLSPSRVEAVGFGEKNPIATNETIAGRAENRRIELVVRK
jgi:outer membrane protein OmpA-like peptidoglycan-associated protein